MNNFKKIVKRLNLDNLSTRLTWSMVIMYGFFAAAFFLDWTYNLQPQFRTAEQAKADILMVSNTAPLERALSAGDLNRVKTLGNQLLLLEDPATGEHLINGIEVVTIEGDKVIDEAPGDDFDGFISETILFSPDEERNILGSAAIYYSGHYFARLKKAGLKRLYIIFGFLVFILILNRLLLDYMLRPLWHLTLSLKEFDPTRTARLPELKGPESVEINRVKKAIDSLLSALKDHQEKLEEKVAERTAELAEANEILRVEIEERKRTQKALEEAKESAEAANRAKSEFLANMSHEIRTPMNSVIGLAGLALNQELPPRMRNYLETIQSSAISLLGIIDDILDFSKIEAGELQIEKVDFWLQDVMEGLSDMFCEKAAEKGIELIIHIGGETPTALMGDPMRLEQILINLTGNAVKFTEEGEVFIKVEPLKRFSDGVELFFSVRDTGIGIERERIESLFNAFTQADSSTTRKYGGTGLGLTICRRLVQIMGGRIWADSEEGVGSVFNFTASFKCQGEEGERKLVTPQDIRSLKVLVVDDNQTSRDILQEILESFTFKVELASGADEALEKLREGGEEGSSYQLILMDWKMPGTDGITASEKIKHLPGLENIPIIMMTAFGREPEKKKAEEVGIDAFLMKPIKQSLLFNTIMEVFGKEKTEEKIDERRMLTREALNIKKLEGIKVLLVEDNIINQDVATEMLQVAGIAVDKANNGQEAVDAVEKHSYDAVLMDIQMPEMDGYEATRIIRTYLHHARLPIIAMTAHALKGDREKCLAAGMNDYVTKPIDPTALITVLARWVTHQDKEAVDERLKAVEAVPEREIFLSRSIPGFDLEEALDRLSGNKKLFLEILEKVQRDYAEFSNRIRDLLRAEERDEAFRQAHTLRGVSGNISAKDLHQAAQELEIEINKGDKKKVEALIEVVEEKLKEVLRSIEILLREKGTQPADEREGKKESLSSGEVTALMKKMAKSLNRNDPVVSDRNMAIIRDQFTCYEYKELVLRLEERIKAYEFKEARKILDEIARTMGISL